MVVFTLSLQVIIVHKLISKFSISEGRSFVAIVTVRRNHNERIVLLGSLQSSRRLHQHFYLLNSVSCYSLFVRFGCLIELDPHNWDNNKKGQFRRSRQSFASERHVPRLVKWRKRLAPANLGSRQIRKRCWSDTSVRSCQTCLMLKSQESLKEKKNTQTQKL